MNRIYRIIFNRALGVYQAVSETATSGCGGSKASATAAFVAGVAVLTLLVPQAHAADAANAAVVAGAGNVSTAGNTTTINQGTARLAIDWTSLSTGANEALVFNQPNAQAIALNRIIGSSPSNLLGSLTANGQVFILNPNGVLFGAGSQVNVGGLVASTLNMSNADFESGNFKFTSTGSRASVVNQGQMTAAPGGYLSLLAPEVRNEGVMTATLGTALLAAGNKVTLNLDNGSLLGYSIDQGAVNALAENKQLIQADGGQVLLSAKAMDALTTATVNNSGVIEAKTIQNKAGRIMLMGDMERGTVNVGGTLDASAPMGSGANASVGGNGGFIETSAAHVNVADSTRVTTQAASGKTGTWLIDPNDFTIAASNGDMTGAAVASNLANTNFEIKTATMGTGGGNGDIFVNDALTWTSANTLTLTAERDIAINSAISATSGGLAINAQRNISAPVAVDVGSFTLNSGTWSQIATSLPSFSATNFGISGGTFIRALGGNGTAGSAYQLSDVYGLQGAGSNGMLSKSYVLANNIDASGTSGWNAGAGFSPIGSFNAGLTGGFDGLGHTISNLAINRPTLSDVGLFSDIGAAGHVANVGLIGGTITGGDRVGGLAAVNRGSISKSYNTGDVKANGKAGGLVGDHFAGSISESYATGTVEGENGTGGLAGYSNATITNSYATGAVNGGSLWTGGLVGYHSSGSIIDSYATGPVTGQSGFGGLTGSTGTVINSFWNTQTSGQNTSGGGLGKSSAQMMQAATFTGAGWNASNVGGDGTVWRIYEGQTAPLLRSFLTAVTLTDATVTYNGANQGAAALPNLLGGRNVGTYSSYSNQQGYDITGGNLTIDKANLTLSAVSVSKAYDGNTTSSASVAVTGLQGSDTVSSLSQSFASKNALGTNASLLNVNTGFIVNDGYNGNNYDVTVSATGAAGTVTPKALSYTTNAANKVYDGNITAAATISGLVGLVGSETVGAIAGATFNSKDVLAANTVTINSATLTNGTNGGVASNYSIAGGGTAAAVITHKALTVIANDASRYLSGIPYLGGNGVRYSGFVAGESSANLTGALTYGGNSQGAILEGTYAITPGGLTASNYALGFVDGALTIISPFDPVPYRNELAYVANVPRQGSAPDGQAIRARLNAAAAEAQDNDNP